MEEQEGRSWSRDPQYRLPYPVPDVADSRWGLVYDMINVFLVEDATEFWNRKADSADPDRSTYDSKDLFGSDAARIVVQGFERPDIPWNDEQNRAIHDVINWYKDRKRAPIFRLFGYAGTGKTQL
ncbi:hypothetical protein ACQX8V_14380, partial [Staphylococcus aureus]